MSKQPHLLVEPADIADIALVPGDPDRVKRIADACDWAEELTANREYTVTAGEYSGRELTICSTGVGSPSAAVAIEELLRCGVETFIRVGTCGALQPDIEIGEHVIATAAAKDEGTTKRYESATIPAVASVDVINALTDAAADLDSQPRRGAIVTDDAFYAETPEYVKAWSAAGLLAIEMEAAAIYTLARRNGARAGAICTVDGNLVKGTQKGETDTDDEDEELPAASREAVGEAITVALEAATTL